MSNLTDRKETVPFLASIIIPCYNTEKYIGEAIESVLNQTYDFFELIIINDGSKDKSEEVIKKYCLLDKRVKYFNQENKGVSEARNKGIEEAKGEFIAFLDADDAWEPENLEIKIQLLKENRDIDWVFSDVYLADENLTKIGIIEGGDDSDILSSLLSRKGDVIHAPSNIVVRNKCLGSTLVLYDKNLSTSADWDFCLQLAAKKFIGKRISSPLWSYRVLENSMSRNLQATEKDNLYVHQKANKQKLFKSYLFKRQCFSNNYLILAGCWWVNGNNKSKGLYYIIKSVLFYPPNSLKLLNKLKYYNFYQAKRKPLWPTDNVISRSLHLKNIKKITHKNVTIFLFHRVNTCEDALWNPMRPEHFEQIIVYLKKHFEFVALKDYLLDNYIPKTQKPLCAIGFDDGYRDFLDYALPILKKYDCPSSMYIVTDCIDNDLPPWTYRLNHYFINSKKLKISIDTTGFPGHLKNTEWRTKADMLEYARQLNHFMKSLDNDKRRLVYEDIAKEFNDVPPPHGLMLNWEEVKELRNHNCEVGSHTVSHPMLSKKLSYTELMFELKESALIIEKHTGTYPATISYPFGAYNNDVKKAAFEAGYKIGVTVNPSPYDSSRHNILEIPRIELFDEPFIKTRLRINEIVPKIRKIITFKG